MGVFNKTLYSKCQITEQAAFKGITQVYNEKKLRIDD